MKKSIKSFFVIVALSTLFNVSKANEVNSETDSASVVQTQPKKRSNIFGFASYYSDKHHGKKTASGEKFDMFKLTAAHKTLPFGTRLKVTNTKNGKIVFVTVNDRGPYAKNRVIDLSFSAAKKLDMIKSGTTKVSIEIIS